MARVHTPRPEAGSLLVIPAPTPTQAAAKAELEFTAVPFCIVFGADGGVRYKGDPSKIDFATVFDAPAASEEAVTNTCAKRAPARCLRRPASCPPHRSVDAAVARGRLNPTAHRPVTRPGRGSPPLPPTHPLTCSFSDVGGRGRGEGIAQARGQAARRVQPRRGRGARTGVRLRRRGLLREACNVPCS